MSRRTDKRETIVVEAYVVDDVEEVENPSQSTHAQAAEGTEPNGATAKAEAACDAPEGAATKARGAKQMLTGGLIAAVGVPMLILPGPGVAAIAGGVALAGRGYQNMTGNDPISEEVREDPHFQRGHQAGEEFVERMRDFAADDLAPAGARVAASLKEAGTAAGQGVKDAASAAAQLGSKGFRAAVGDEKADKVADFSRKNIAPVADAAAGFGRGVVESIKPHAAKAAAAGSHAAAGAAQKLADKARDLMC